MKKIKAKYRIRLNGGMGVRKGERGSLSEIVGAVVKRFEREQKLWRKLGMETEKERTKTKIHFVKIVMRKREKEGNAKKKNARFQ